MTRAHGVDLSYANAGDPSGPQDFVIARAVYGTKKDYRYEQHKAAARAKHQVFGAYAFGVYGSGVTQALAFLAAAGSGVNEYVLDLEVEKGKPRMTDTQARAFIATVRAKRGRCILYHSDSGFPSLGQSGNWVAKWSDTQPARPWKYWQYHGAPLDRDLFNGTVGELRAYVGLVTPLPPTDTAPVLWNVVITGATRLYNRPFGTVVGTVTKASYRCTRTKVGGAWWYRIVSGITGKPTTLAGKYFRASSNMVAHLA